MFCSQKDLRGISVEPDKPTGVWNGQETVCVRTTEIPAVSGALRRAVPLTTVGNFGNQLAKWMCLESPDSPALLSLRNPVWRGGQGRMQVLTAGSPQR